MPTFRYTALDATGTLQRGTREAADEAEVIAWLQHQGRLPMRAEPLATGFLSGLLEADFRPRRGLSAQQVTEMTRELATMLGAGQDLDRALRYLQETAPRQRVHRVVTDLRDAVRDGSPLSTALQRHAGSFSRMYIGMVAAGEAGGKLAPALERLAELMERQRSVAAAITSAMIYPVLLIIGSIGAVVLLLTQVLPEFAPLFEQSGAQLPPSTQFLIDAGAFVTNYGMLMLLGVLAAALIARAMLRRPGPQMAMDRLLIRLPIIGNVRKEILAARFTRTLGTLLANGVPLIAALAVVREALGSPAGAAAVDSASQTARGGAGIVPALTDAAIFPVRTIHLLRLGEENAQLSGMALRAADIHEEKVRLALQRLTSLLVPAITIIMGAVVAGIVSSLLQAMLSLNNLANS